MSGARGREDEALVLLAEGLEPVTPSPGARARLSAAVRGPLRYLVHAPRVASLFALDEAAVAEALGAASSGEGFQPELWPGAGVLRHRALPHGTVIARIPAGLVIDEHSHPRRELTYVLEGELWERGPGITTLHTRGSALDMPAGSAHTVEVDASGPCLVVFGLR